MSAAAAERRFALTKVDVGDYLLPSNDARTLWRIRKYWDGPSSGLDALPSDRQFWGVWKWRGVVGDGEAADVSSLDEWDMWDMVDSGYDRRSEAIAAAMRFSS